jgi:hypothetical protein
LERRVEDREEQPLDGTKESLQRLLFDGALIGDVDPEEVMADQQAMEMGGSYPIAFY